MEEIKQQIESLSSSRLRLFSSAAVLLVLLLLFQFTVSTLDLGTIRNGGAELSSKEIILGWNKWPGVLPYLIAYEKGFFHENGLNITLKNEVSYGEMISELESRKIDFSGDIALIDMILRSDDAGTLVGVGVTDYSDGADGIIAKRGINKIADLRGKKVGAEENTLGEMLLLHALSDAGVSLQDVSVINISAEESVVALQRGELDAAVSYEPSLSSAVTKGVGKIIYTSADAPKLITDLLVFNQSTLAESPEIARAVIAAYFKALDFISENPTESLEIGGKYFGMDPDLFGKIVKKIKFAGKEENGKAFLNYGDEDSLYGNFRLITAFLLSQDKISAPPDETDLLRSDFMIKATKNN